MANNFIEGKKVNEVIICECNSPEHNIIFRYVEDGDQEHWNSVYMNVHLRGVTFKDRLKNIWQYLIYGTSQYGEYDEMILPPDQETITKLENVTNYLKKIKKAQEEAAKS